MINKLLTQINACGLCPHSRKPRKGLINTDGKINAVKNSLPCQTNKKIRVNPCLK